MVARGGRNNLVARRVIDDLIDISEERSPLNYLKIFIEQQITDHRQFIARMRDEIRTSTNLISQLNALIAELEASGWNCQFSEKIMVKRIDLEMLEAECKDGFNRDMFGIFLSWFVYVLCCLDLLDRVAKLNAALLQLNGVFQVSLSAYRRTRWIRTYERENDKKKEIKPDEEPSRGILWLKGRVNKDGEYLNDEIRSVGDKLKETKDKIKEGTLKVDHGTNAMTFVLGKEKGGYARGVGSGATYKRYFDLPRSRQASDERILLLKSQLDNKRLERQEKELL
ncbi:hypothetical protein Tco_0520339 [Tanacetum coccineum]